MRENQTLWGVLPPDHGREALDERRLGELVDLVSGVAVGENARQSKTDRLG